jgi:hypothetical protein
MKKTRGGTKYDTTSDSDLEEQIKEYGEKKRIEGGTLRRKNTRKSNGHKSNCGCPICNNMKKTRKNRKTRGI